MAYRLLLNGKMKTVIISNDNHLINIVKNLKVIPENQLGIYSENSDALEIMSHVCTAHPSILVIDDDFTKPQSAQVLNAIRKVNNTVKIVFISSDSSVELGRDVSQVRILYHAVKPVDKNEINDLFNSINL
jgi:two-component SAPR family response regulator